MDLCRIGSQNDPDITVHSDRVSFGMSADQALKVLDGSGVLQGGHTTSLELISAAEQTHGLPWVDLGREGGPTSANGAFGTPTCVKNAYP